MAFFDNIGKKISQTGQMAVQKTKEMADVAKINATISDEEKKVNNAYYQIGQLYVSLHNDDYEPDFEALIIQLNESQKNIENLKKEIQDIKGVQRCVTCGAEIPNNATFCSSCGTAVVQQKAVDAINLIKCSNCGKMIEKGMKFCTFCGSEVVVRQNENAEKKCVSCGATLANEVRFCTQCGTSVPQNDDKLFNQSETEVFVPDNSMQYKTNIEEEFGEQVANQKEINMPVQAVQTSEKRCSNCGTVLEENSLFCTECGTKVN